MYDLAGADDAVRFSPYCWRTKMSLLHKGLDFETVPWRFTDKEAIADSGQPRVPAIVDGGKWLADSWAIACYLDDTYPQNLLMGDGSARALSRFVAHWCDASVHPAIRPLALLAVHDVAHEKDKVYFRESREAMLGKTLEEVCADQSGARANLLKVLTPAEMALSESNYLGGAGPCFADYALFGSLMWLRALHGDAPLEAGSALRTWFDRLLDLHGGYARKAPTAA